MKLCYASDLHGHLHHYEALLNLAQSQKVEAMLLGGDLLPHQGRRNLGLAELIRFVREIFTSFTSHLREQGVRSLGVILGNDDCAGVLTEFQKLERKGLLSLLNDAPLFLNPEIAVFGYPFVPPTPFLLKDFEKRDRNEDTYFFQRRLLNPLAFEKLTKRLFLKAVRPLNRIWLYGKCLKGLVKSFMSCILLRLTRFSIGCPMAKVLEAVPLWNLFLGPNLG